jgi:hypothetical protein
MAERGERDRLSTEDPGQSDIDDARVLAARLADLAWAGLRQVHRV